MNLRLALAQNRGFAGAVALLAALYLGRMVAQVKASDVTHAQVVELITAGRSGNLGLPPESEGTNGFDDNGVDL